MLPSLDLSDFNYILPEARIAQYPLAQRDLSKLLVYGEGAIQHHHFKDLVELLPADTALIINNTEVIPARLFFQKETGATIEIFLLSPQEPAKEMLSAMNASSPCIWDCMVGNQKRWRPGQVLNQSLIIEGETVEVSATQLPSKQVQFSWQPKGIRFEQIVEAFGQMPLPPYMNRSAETDDTDRYQTVYAQDKGAVAAPTAGLHFTNELLSELYKKGVSTVPLTLHVGAGTFQPIKSDDVYSHPMHREQMVVSKNSIEALAKSTYRVAVGTTSLRTLESLYWYGVKLINQEGTPFFIEKLYPYQPKDHLPDFTLAMEAILQHMQQQELSHLQGGTEIFIFPSYRIRSIQALVTNFHLPQSTLILLVAALVGDDWRKIYQTAMEQDYRFLSYGDSSLLFNPHRD